MIELAVYCADVGSIAKGNFGWARGDPGDTVQMRKGTEIRDLATATADDLDSGKRVAIGFECPLFVPLPDKPERLTAGRHGDGNRPWSAAAGATALAMGLTEVTWLLGKVLELVSNRVTAHLDWNDFLASDGGLFVWEAFVTGSAKGTDHADDAAIAVNRFIDALPDVASQTAISDKTVLSLAGAALLRSGWSTDIGLLGRACTVLRA